MSDETARSRSLESLKKQAKRWFGALRRNVPDARTRFERADPDAPMKGGFTHWVVWNISPKTNIIKQESIPPGSIEGRNSAGRNGYIGPCPPSGTHHYHFQLYALRDALDLTPTALFDDVQSAIENHLITKTDLVGLYAR